MSFLFIDCGSCYHRECFVKGKCPKCERLLLRYVVNYLPAVSPYDLLCIRHNFALVTVEPFSTGRICLREEKIRRKKFKRSYFLRRPFCYKLNFISLQIESKPKKLKETNRKKLVQ